MQKPLILAVLLTATVSLAQTAGAPVRSKWLLNTNPVQTFASDSACTVQAQKDVLIAKRTLVCTKTTTVPYIPAPTSTPAPSPLPTASPTTLPSPAPTPTPTQAASPSPGQAGQVSNPIIFAAQWPSGDAFAGRMAVFANHLPQTPGSATDKGVFKGGDLYIRYQDGTLRNLTAGAGFTNIAVREPTVHWNGTKAVFSMVGPSATWQMYEVTGLAQGQTAVFTKLPGQPAYNNVSPIYATDDKVLFTSDAPRFAHLYPMADEYESTPSLTGFYSLDTASASYKPLNKTPSGAFTPTIDSFGRVIFTRWDHLVQDQQAEANEGAHQAYNLASEAAGAARVAALETFPEHRFGGQKPSTYGPVNQHQFNVFQPWQMNQDGTAELTLNHVGRHEFSLGSGGNKSFAGDPNLADVPNLTNIANQFAVRVDAGLFGIKEDRQAPGIYYAVYAPEFSSFAAGSLVRFNAPSGLSAEQMVITQLTSGVGRHRNVLPLSTGALVSAYSASGQVNQNAGFRLTALSKAASGQLTVGSALTGGIVKNGTTLWEIEPAEVVARTRPTGKIDDGLDAAAKQVLAEEGVTEAEMISWLRANNLALIVTNNQTKRDRADTQQPQNLEVPGGVKTAANNGQVYPIQHFQVIEGNQVRGYAAFNGSNEAKRTIGQPAAQGKNPPNPTGPAGSVKISPDGSTAAFVQAGRALAWQTTDAGGVPIVRERVWVTMQPGEARTCAGCHGSNTRTQDGGLNPVNKPEALRDLLRFWKLNK